MDLFERKSMKRLHSAGVNTHEVLSLSCALLLFASILLPVFGASAAIGETLVPADASSISSMLADNVSGSLAFTGEPADPNTESLGDARGVSGLQRADGEGVLATEWIGTQKTSEEPLPIGIAAADELADFMSALMITDNVGTVVYPVDPQLPLISGKPYIIMMHFEESTEPFSPRMDAGVSYTYQFPSEMAFPEAYSGYIPSMSGSPQLPEAIAFSIDTNGLLTLVLSPEYRAKYSIAVSFDLDLMTHFEGDGKMVFPFNGGDYEIDLEPPPPIPLELGKNYSYDRQTECLTYTVAVDILEDDVENIKLRDTMFQSADGITSGAFSGTALTYLRSQINGSLQYSVNGGLATSIAPTWVTLDGSLGGGGVFDLTFPGPYDRGDTILVTYTIDINQFATLAPWNLTRPETKGMNYAFWMKNIISAYLDDIQPKNLVDEKEVSTDLIKETFILKKRISNTSSTMTWCIEIGNGRDVLNGKTITDVYGAGITGYVAGSMKVTLYDRDTTTWERGSVISGYNVLSVSPTTISSGDFTYEIPNLSSADVYYVYLEYTTTADSGSLWEYSNVAKIDFPGDPQYTVLGSLPPEGLTTVKTPLLIPEERIIEYTLVLNTPQQMYNNSYYIQDTIRAEGPAGTVQFASLPPNDLVVTVVSKSGGTPTTLTRDVDYRTTSTGAAWIIYFPDGTGSFPTAANYRNGVFPFNDDVIITITYSVPLDKPLSGSGPATLEDHMKIANNNTPANQAGGVLYNFGYQLWNQGGKNAGSNTFNYYPIQKNAVWVDGGAKIIEYRVRLDAYYLSALTEAILTDTFDSRLKLVDDALYIGYKSVAPTYANIAQWGPPQNIKPFWGVLGGACNTIKVTANTTTTSDPAVKRFSADLLNPAVMNPIYRPGRVYEVVYRMQVVDMTGFVLGEDTIDNVANIRLNGEDYSQNCSLVMGNSPVTKQLAGGKLDGNTANWSIRINPQGLILNGEEGYYDVIDEMTESMAFYTSTIKLEKETSPGSNSWVTLTKGDVVDANTYTLISINDHEIFMEVPDGVSLRLSYSALVKGAVGETVSLKNTVSILGSDYESAIEGDYMIESIGGGAGGTGRTTLDLQKLSDPDQDPIEGAYFALYVDWYYPNAHPTPPSGVDATRTFGSRTFYYVGVGTTDSNGMFTFEDSDGIVRTLHNLYALVELDAPKTHSLPTGDDAITFFSFDPISQTKRDEIGEPLWDRYYGQIAQLITIYNERKPADTTLTISKTVEGSYAYKNKMWEFTASIEDDQGEPIRDFEYKIMEGSTQVGSGTLSTGATGSATFQLTHGQKIIIDEVPLAAYIRIVESLSSDDRINYDTSFIDSEAPSSVVEDHDTGGSSNNSAIMLEMSEDRQFDFTNEWIQIPDAYLSATHLTFIVLAVVAFAGAITVQVYRTKRLSAAQ